MNIYDFFKLNENILDFYEENKEGIMKYDNCIFNGMDGNINYVVNEDSESNIKEYIIDVPGYTKDDIELKIVNNKIELILKKEKKTKLIVQYEYKIKDIQAKLELGQLKISITRDVNEKLIQID